MKNVNNSVISNNSNTCPTFSSNTVVCESQKMKKIIRSPAINRKSKTHFWR